MECLTWLHLIKQEMHGGSRNNKTPKHFVCFDAAFINCEAHGKNYHLSQLLIKWFPWSCVRNLKHIRQIYVSSECCMSSILWDDYIDCVCQIFHTPDVFPSPLIRVLWLSCYVHRDPLGTILRRRYNDHWSLRTAIIIIYGTGVGGNPLVV